MRYNFSAFKINALLLILLEAGSFTVVRIAEPGASI